MLGVCVAVLAIGACLVVVSHTAGRVELVDRHSGIAPLQPQHADGFAKDWDGWLRKVTLQVRAAVDLAKGLPAAKKDRLDGILSHDVVRAPCAPGPALLRARACGAPCSAARPAAHQVTRRVVPRQVKDEKEGEEVAATLRARYGGSRSSAAPGSAAARRKAAVQAAAHSLVKAAHAAKAHSEDLERAAPKVNEAQIKAQVRVEGRAAIDPYGKRLGNKVARDDAAVQADEMRVQMAEKKLESEETPTAGVAPHGPAENASPKPARGRLVRTHASAQKKASAAVQASVKPAAVSASGLGSHKMKDMEGDIKMVMAKTLHGDKKKAAQEEKQEEQQFARELHKLGLAPAVSAKPKSKVHWPSQLELPGQQHAKKAPYEDV